MVPNLSASGSASTRSSARRWNRVAIAAALAASGILAYTVWQFRSPPVGEAQTEVLAPTEIQTVTALGRLEPKGEVIELSAPTSNEGNRVEQLLVEEGDAIEAGQVIAVLDRRDRLQADLQEAEEQVKIAEAELARVQAGAQRGEIDAQKATIVRLEAQRQGNLATQAATVARLAAELQNAEVEFDRYHDLHQEGAISASERDAKYLTLETARKSLREAQAELTRLRSTSLQEINQARATLDRIVEVRPVDVRVAEADVNRAIAAVNQAQTQLDQAYVRAPQAGTVLKIHTRPGELVASDGGIVELGQTSQMYAIAEVYESDVAKVRPGQQARITSTSLPDRVLHGTVEQIGLQIERQNIVNEDPTNNIDAKIVEVNIKLDDTSSEQVALLTNLQVMVAIEL